MAATRLISMHVNKGKTVAQCLKARTDYSMNEAKTNEGEYISSYECDPKTVDEEFLLAKRQYQHITGRTQKDDVIAYQIRQAFKPGEVTPEEANEIGYELAMRFTKGRHAFIVATHVDRAHIHNHIIYNSTSLDHTRKFRDFRRSGLAVQRVSDSICLEHGLSVIKPLPFGERRKRAAYPEEESFRDKIRASIEQCMQQKPKSVEDLLRMLEEAGYEVKRGKNLALRGKGQKRFIRFRSLGEEYLLSELEQRMQEGTEKKRERVGEKRPFDLLINIQEKLRQGKSGGYERWAKVFNLKQISQALLFLQEHGIRDLETLNEKTTQATSRFTELSKSIKDAEKRLAEIAVLRTHIINYAKTRELYVAYRKAGYSRKFFEAHREEIMLHQAAKKAFSELNLEKLPRVKELNEEYARVLAEKRAAYSEYRQAKKEMQDFLIAQKNVETILGEVRKEQNEKNRETSTRS